MKISRKFDVFTLVSTAVFICALVISYRTITTISSETLMLFDVSREFDYLTRVKQTLTDLQHSAEHFIHMGGSDAYSDAMMKNLAEYEQVLRLSSTMRLDPEELALIDFATKNLPGCSAVIQELINSEGRLSQENKDSFERLRTGYIEKILSHADKHWQVDLEKVGRLSGKVIEAKSRSLLILLILLSAMLLLIVAARLAVSRFIIRPIRTIEDISNAIAGGDTGRRIDIHSDDELGSLSSSINTMAAAIQDKLQMLENAVSNEQALVREQTILNELMGFIASGADLELVLRIFLGRTKDLMRAEQSAIFIMEPREPLDPELKIFFNTYEDETSMEYGRAMLRGVFINVVRTSTPLRVNEPLTEAPGSHVQVRNLLAVPLSSIDRGVLGLIVIVNKDGGFSQHDEDMLFNFSFQAFQAITMQQEIVRYATTDGLTGLHNHRVFREKLHEEIERSRRYARDVSLLMIDIDHFKLFNDTYGHQAGDEVLRTVADLIRRNIRTTDFGARYGGEEFSVILPETSGSQALTVAERLCANIMGYDLVLASGDRPTITVSIGCATFPWNAETDELLIKKSDENLYAAKRGGRNRVVGSDRGSRDSSEASGASSA
ncbi:MAG: diguanylate cyclase [Nitrospiraceae bacterium]|nr:diguanylate cyclase [Nitrospiraceae bacterium]